jgi:hypothetical protein
VCIFGIGAITEIVLGIVVCGMGKQEIVFSMVVCGIGENKKLYSQWWFVELKENKNGARNCCLLELDKKKTMTKPSAKVLKRKKGIVK